MKTIHQIFVEDFMKLAQQELPESPTIPSVEVRMLRARLILEECLETISGLGITVWFEMTNRRTVSFDDLSFEHTHPPNLVEVIDGCCDIKVVTTGTLSACGVDDQDYQDEVDLNNLKKFGPGGFRDQKGKWIKPPGHTPPDIKALLDAEIKRKNGDSKH